MITRRSEEVRNQLDSCRVSRRGAQRAIARDQRGIERLGERQVHSVVRRHVLTQFPDSSGKIDMAVSQDGQQCQVLDRFFRTPGAHVPAMNQTPQRAEDLHVEEMRRVEDLITPV